MSAFAWQPVWWHNLAAFESHLKNTPRPGWLRGLTIHHTAGLASDWRGMESLDGFREMYEEQNQWPSGPHLFLAAGSPGYDGIFQATPLETPGTHAGRCNESHIGIEIVGVYDVVPWPERVSALAYAVMRALCSWGNLPAENVQGHRECLPNKTCPGRAIDMPAVRRELASILDVWPLWGDRCPLPVEQRGYAIPQLWRQNAHWLGEARTAELYPINGVALRIFQGGIVWWLRATERAYLSVPFAARLP